MDNKQLINDNTARIEALTERLKNTTLTDVSDTTATASDVVAGKTFYGADGVKAEGTYSINLQEKTATENGDVVADEGYDGLSKVVVNVASSGSGEDMLQARVDATNSCDYLMYNYKGDNVDFLANLDTSNVTSMKYMFSACKSLVEILLTLNTSKVTSMSCMFYACTALTSLPQMDTSKVVDMSYFVSNCTKLANIQLDCSSVTNLQCAFEMCTELTDVALTNANNVNNASSLFKLCKKLVNVSGLNPINVSDLGSCFEDCKALLSIPQGDYSKVTSFRRFCYGCDSLTKAQLDVSSATSLYSMFESCDSITEILLSNTNKVTNMNYAFEYCPQLTTVSELDLISVTSWMSVFVGSPNITDLTLKNIKITLQIGGGTDYSNVLSLDSLVNTIKELWDYSSGTTTYKLTIGSTNLETIANTYVKLITPTDEQIAADPNLTSKMPCEVCESTDEGAMLITDYALIKGWEVV